MVAGRPLPRQAEGVGVFLHDTAGDERGGYDFIATGEAVMTLDRPTGEGVAAVVDDRQGFAGLAVFHRSPLGQYREAVTLGTVDAHGREPAEAFLKAADSTGATRARLSVLGVAAPVLPERYGRRGPRWAAAPAPVDARGAACGLSGPDRGRTSGARQGEQCAHHPGRPPPFGRVAYRRRSALVTLSTVRLLVRRGERPLSHTVYPAMAPPTRSGELATGDARCVAVLSIVGAGCGVSW